MNHQQLVHRATKWLRSRDFKAVLAEPTAVGNWEIPDALGWEAGGASAMVECKTSRSDFLADRKKEIRTAPHDKQLGNERWFMTTRRLLDRDEVPDGWGLVEVTEQKAFVVKPAVRHKVKNVRLEQILLVTALGRIQDDRYAEAFLCPQAHTEAKHWAQLIIKDSEGLEVGTVGEELDHDPFKADTDIYRRAAMFEALRSRVNTLAHAVFSHRRRIMNGLELDQMGRLAANLRVVVQEVSKATKSKG